jgi:hypothetical protein
MASSAGAIYASPVIYGFGVKMIVGSFAPNGASNPVAASNKGKGWTVTHTATGVWSVLLNTTYVSLLAGLCDVQQNAAGSMQILMRGACDPSAASPVIQLANSPAGTDADISANANNRIHFCFFLASSDLNK